MLPITDSQMELAYTIVRRKQRDFIYAPSEGHGQVGPAFVGDVPLVSSGVSVRLGILPRIVGSRSKPSNLASVEYNSKSVETSRSEADSASTAWLRNAREHFDELSAKLESEILTFELTELYEMTSREGIILPYRIHVVRHEYNLLNRHLRNLPSSFDVAQTIQKPRSWTYVIDLDNEVFCIRHREGPGGLEHSFYFALSAIPKDRCFTDLDAFRFGPHDRFTSSRQAAEQLVIKSQLGACREGTVRPSYNRVVVNPLPGRLELQDTIGLILFDRMVGTHLQHWWNAIPFEDSASFAFREVAFAVLSIATGQFYMDSVNLPISGRHRRVAKNYYLIRETEEDQPQLIPTLGTSYCIESHEPGASPVNQVTYWFQNVLVKLVSDDLLSDTAAVMERAIGFAQLFRKSNFFILLFSIRRAVFAEVQKTSVATTVRETDIMDVYHDHFGIRAPYTGSSRICLSLEQMLTRYAGFRTLQKFFKVALARQRYSSRDSLPSEIYAHILQFTDLETQKACTNLSPILHEVCGRQVLFSRNLNIVDLDPADDDESLNAARGCRVGTFTFKSKDTREIMKTTLCPSTAYGAAWFPVVGRRSRPSAIRQISLYTRPGVWQKIWPIVDDAWLDKLRTTRRQSVRELVVDGHLRTLY